VVAVREVREGTEVKAGVMGVEAREEAINNKEEVRAQSA